MNVQTSCGNWHRGWGFGNTNIIGKLSFNSESEEYIFSGKRQGRHYEKYGKTPIIVFTLQDWEDAVESVRWLRSNLQADVDIAIFEIQILLSKTIAKNLKAEKLAIKRAKVREGDKCQLKLNL